MLVPPDAVDALPIVDRLLLTLTCGDRRPIPVSPAISPNTLIGRAPLHRILDEHIAAHPPVVRSPGCEHGDSPRGRRLVTMQPIPHGGIQLRGKRKSCSRMGDGATFTRNCSYTAAPQGPTNPSKDREILQQTSTDWISVSHTKLVLTGRDSEELNTER